MVDDKKEMKLMQKHMARLEVRQKAILTELRIARGIGSSSQQLNI